MCCCTVCPKDMNINKVVPNLYWPYCKSKNVLAKQLQITIEYFINVKNINLIIGGSFPNYACRPI